MAKISHHPIRPWWAAKQWQIGWWSLLLCGLWSAAFDQSWSLTHTHTSKGQKMENNIAKPREIGNTIHRNFRIEFLNYILFQKKHFVILDNMEKHNCIKYPGSKSKLIPIGFLTCVENKYILFFKNWPFWSNLAIVGHWR